MSNLVTSNPNRTWMQFFGLDSMPQPNQSLDSDGVGAATIPRTNGGRKRTYRKKGAGSKYKSVMSLIKTAPPAPPPKKKGGKKTKRSQSGRKSNRS